MLSLAVFHPCLDATVKRYNPVRLRTEYELAVDPRPSIYVATTDFHDTIPCGPKRCVQPLSIMVSEQVRTAPAPGSTGSALKPLSCIECQKRKVKCDKRIPCTSCTQRGVDCHPAAVDPNKPRKKRFAERVLLDRIRKYEALLEAAGIDKDEDTSQFDAQAVTRKRPRLSSTSSTSSSVSGSSCSNGKSSPTTPPPRTVTIDPDIGHIESILETVSPFDGVCHGTPQSERGPGLTSSTINSNGATSPAFSLSTPVHHQANHAVSSALVIHKHLDLMYPDDGSKHFVFDDPSPDEPLEHGEASLMFRLLHTYQQNVHPIIKVIHMPTVRERLCDITADPKTASPSDHALFFAINYLVVNTLSPEDTERLFGAREKVSVSEEYRRKTRTALGRAGVWRSSHLATLQAYVLYLLSVTKDVDPRTYAIYVANAGRMAQRLVALYKRQYTVVSSTTSRSAVDREMANRLWWEIQLCDMRSCEKAGVTSYPSLATAMNALPKSSSDEDLEQLIPPTTQSTAPTATSADAWMPAPPNTECLFLLLRCEIAQFNLHPPWSLQHPGHPLQHHLFRRTAFSQQHLKAHEQPGVTLESRLAAIDTFERYIWQRYFDPAHATSSILVQYARHHARIWIDKMRVLEHLNHRSAERDIEIVRLCTVQVEETVKLFANAQYLRFQWYTYSQLPFFAFVVLLDLLRSHTTGPLIDRAWAAIEGSALIWRPDLKSKKQTGSRADSPNIHVELDVKDKKTAMQIRGSMLVALMVAAWERRSQALAALNKSGSSPPPEPVIVTAMRSAAAIHRARLHPTSSALTNAATPTFLPKSRLHPGQDSLQQHEAQGAQKYLDGQQSEATQQTFGEIDFNQDWAAFLDPLSGTTGSAYDDMLNLNSLLQSSVDLDWTAWFGPSMGPTPYNGAGIAGTSSSAEFLPSL